MLVDNQTVAILYFVFARPSTALQAIRINSQFAGTRQSGFTGTQSGLPRRLLLAKTMQPYVIGYKGFT